MPRYYFDLRDGDDVTADQEGMELRDIEAVQEEAVLSLADMARPAIRRNWRRSAGHSLAIQVRDATGPVLQVKFVFAVSRLSR